MDNLSTLKDLQSEIADNEPFTTLCHVNFFFYCTPLKMNWVMTFSISGLHGARPKVSNMKVIKAQAKAVLACRKKEAKAKDAGSAASGSQG